MGYFIGYLETSAMWVCGIAYTFNHVRHVNTLNHQH